MASSLLNLSDHLRSMASSLVSVAGAEDLAGEECLFLDDFPLVTLVSGQIS